MSAPLRKWISVSDAIIGEEYLGYKTLQEPQCEHMCSITYQGDGRGLVFGTIPEEGISHLRCYTTWQEQTQYYIDRFDISNSKNQLNLVGLFSDLYNVGDAHHEMWNAWVGTDFYEMNDHLSEEAFVLVGIAAVPYGCHYLTDPVAYVVEQEDGTRFWCHGERSWVEDMREQMKDVYESYISQR